MLRTTHFSELLLAVACAALLLMSASAAFGEIPQRMHYQGYLALANGEPVDCLDPATCSQPVDLTFRIYSDATADALLWEEDHLGVVVNAGMFSVTLGEDTPITLDLLEGPAFLGIEVNGNEELEPRQELTTAAWAMRCMEAGNAANLGGIAAADYVTGAAAAEANDALQAQITASQGEITTAQAQIASLEEKLAALEEAIAQGGSSGGGGDDPNAPLINGVHTITECNDDGGIVTEIPGPENLCRFAAASCPSGWTQLDNWCTTQSASAGGQFTGFVQACQQLNQSPSSCSVSGHPFLDQPPSTCCGKNVYGDIDGNGKPVCYPQQKCATSPIVEIGCF